LLRATDCLRNPLTATLLRQLWFGSLHHKWCRPSLDRMRNPKQPDRKPNVPRTDQDRSWIHASSVSFAPVRILVVEDFQAFRQFISSTLQRKTEWQVVCEVSDGTEAVHKAAVLQPDLILLDIGLPKLNGLEAARRIAMIAPQSKILFLSQESSADVVQECLRMGGHGYVLKAHAQTDLLPAIEAVLQAKQFVSSRLVGCFHTAAA
jgi:CheY-like chemotaxis protein